MDNVMERYHKMPGMFRSWGEFWSFIGLTVGCLAWAYFLITLLTSWKP